MHGSRQSLAAAATGTVRYQIARLGPNSHAARSRSLEPSARSAGHRTSESHSTAVASESADVRALSRTRRRGFTGGPPGVILHVRRPRVRHGGLRRCEPSLRPETMRRVENSVPEPHTREHADRSRTDKEEACGEKQPRGLGLAATGPARPNQRDPRGGQHGSSRCGGYLDRSRAAQREASGYEREQRPGRDRPRRHRARTPGLCTARPRSSAPPSALPPVSTPRVTPARASRSP